MKIKQLGILRYRKHLTQKKIVGVRRNVSRLDRVPHGMAQTTGMFDECSEIPLLQRMDNPFQHTPVKSDAFHLTIHGAGEEMKPRGAGTFRREIDKTPPFGIDSIFALVTAGRIIKEIRIVCRQSGQRFRHTGKTAILLRKSAERTAENIRMSIIIHPAISFPVSPAGTTSRSLSMARKFASTLHPAGKHSGDF